nr:MarR family transcriptional regulator [Actinomyces sp.]
MTTCADDTGRSGCEDRTSVLAPVHDRLRRLQRLSHRRRTEARTCGGPYADTTGGQGRVLAALRLSSPLPTRDLAYLLDIRQQSLNELLTKLEAQGLIERTPSEGDRRVRVVTLTQAGRDAAIGGDRSEYLGVLSDDEAATLTTLLDKVIASLEEELGLEEDDDVEAWLEEARRRMGEERVAGLRRMREMGYGPERHRGGPRGGHRGGGGPGHGEHHGGHHGGYHGEGRRD